ncbi:MAG: beta-N-acetylhexosaminidase [Peptostreptococcaceae bacterium]
MEKILEKRTSLISNLAALIFLITFGWIRPLIVYLYNIDIQYYVVLPMIILLVIVESFLIKTRKRFSITSFEIIMSIYIGIYAVYANNNVDSIITPILTVISMILVFEEKIKCSRYKKIVTIILGIIGVGTTCISFSDNYGELKYIYDPTNEYKECSILKELPVPINALERNYKLDLDNIEKSTGYRIKGIDMQMDENHLYIEELLKKDWTLIDKSSQGKSTLYTLQKGLNTVSIKINKDNILIGLYKNHIKERIASMTLEEKIGQIIIAGFNGNVVNSEVTTLLEDLKVGGVILFGRNIETSKQLKTLTKDIKNLNKDIPPFISIDEEGGRVSRVPNDTKKFPKAKSVGDTNDTKYAYKNGNDIGKTLKELGINMDHAPVLDIYSNPQNTVIGDRAFGSNEDTVSKMGIATMKGLEDANVIPTVKHFPGHGDTDVDSHIGLPIVTKELSELNKFEFIPFKKAIDKNCDVVMISHIILDKIDHQNPSTLSKKVITDILKKDLGFKGVVITDDINMGAITQNYSVKEASIKSIQAGVDIILIGNDVEITKRVIDEIKSAVENNVIDESRIDESVYKILKLKEKYSI